ncbi:MAG: hypothetical protein ACRDIY_04470 [Chloroflexota bacterium]
MTKKRARRGRVVRTTEEKLTIRRGKRHHFVIISVLVALASVALVVAGFLSYSVPSNSPAPSPTISAPAGPLGSASSLSGVVIPISW